MPLDPVVRARLVEVLEEARRRGLLGPGPVEAQVDHAVGFAEAVGQQTPPAAVDLGSGGGIPGLVLALYWPGSRWTLLDSRVRSVQFVRDAVPRLELQDRVLALLGRAEAVGRDAAQRGRHDLVVARGFGPPSVTAECSAPLLRPGGRLVVSEPPDSDGQRWRADVLELLGLRPAVVVRVQQGTFVVLEQARPCPSTYPRRVGVPAKRPLFTEADVSRETEPGT